MISKKNANYYLLLILMGYFCTKMLWDSITNNITEYCSLLIICIGFLIYIVKVRKSALKLLIIFFVFSLYLLFNALILTDMEHLQRGIYEYIFYMAIFFSIIGFLKSISINKLERIFKFLCYLSIILSILTLIEYIRKVAFIEVEGDIAYGTFISGYGYMFRCKVFTRSYLSHGLIMGILALINMYMYKSEKKIRWIIFYLACIIAVLLTSSRGPLVSTSIATLYFIIDLEDLKSLKKSTIIKNITVGFIGIVFLYMIFSSKVSLKNDTIMYFVSRVRNIFNWSRDAGNLGRIDRWITYWNYFKSNNIWFGSGVSMTGTSGCTTLGMGTTESGILKRLVELGIVGTSIYYTMIITTVKISLKRLKLVYKKEVLLLKKLAVAEILCVLIDDCIVQITEEIMISFYFWAFLALLYCCAFYYTSTSKRI